MRNAVLVPLHLDAFVGQNLTFTHQISVQLKTSEHFRAHFFVFRAQFLTNVGIFGLILSSHAPNDGKIRAPCVIRGVCAAKSAPSWQDLRAVYPPTAVCGAFRTHGAHILPKPAHFGCMARESCRELAIFPSEAAFGMHGAQNLPRIAARERTAAESCHGKAPGNAPREYIATASQAKSASGRNPATVRRWETHFASILPSSSARERTVVKSCHYQSPENAFRAYPAIAGCLGTHSVDILPSPDIRERTASAYRHCRSSGRTTFSTRGSGFRPLAALWGPARNTFCAREWAFRLLGA